MHPIRVFVIDDHPLVREGLRATLGSKPDLTCVGESDGADDVRARVQSAEADVALVDYHLADFSGEKLIGILKEARPQLRVLGMSIRPEVAGPVMLAAGADAFVDKTDIGQLVAMLRQLAVR